MNIDEDGFVEGDSDVGAAIDKGTIGFGRKEAVVVEDGDNPRGCTDVYHIVKDGVEVIRKVTVGRRR